MNNYDNESIALANNLKDTRKEILVIDSLESSPSKKSTELLHEQDLNNKIVYKKRKVIVESSDEEKSNETDNQGEINEIIKYIKTEKNTNKIKNRIKIDELVIENIKENLKINQKTIDKIIKNNRRYTENKSNLERLIKECEDLTNMIKLNIEKVELLHFNKNIKIKNHQVYGIQWLYSLYKLRMSGILADEMGLGKTLQAIGILSKLYEEDKRFVNLVIAPCSTLYHWKNEIQKYCPCLKILVYNGTLNERLEKQEQFQLDRPFIIIANYQSISTNISDKKFIKNLELKALIIDEGHMMKNYKSTRYKFIFSIKSNYKILITGTPLQNNIEELFSLLIFLMPSVFMQKKEFLDEIYKSNYLSTLKNGDSNYIEKIKQIMNPFILRRTKKEVIKDYDLLPKIEQIVHLQLTSKQKQLYDKNNNSKRSICDVSVLRRICNHLLLVRSHYNDSLVLEIANKLKHNTVDYEKYPKDKIIKYLSGCSDFDIDNICHQHSSILTQYQLPLDNYSSHSSKLSKAVQIINQHLTNNEKILVFSQFTETLDIIQSCLDKIYKIKNTRLDGSTPVQDREDLVKEFTENKSIAVFLLSTKAGGFGINLCCANVVILYDLDYNPTNDRQAIDRVHRIGQEKQVFVYKFIVNDSVEEHILDTSNVKVKLSDDLLNDQ